MAIVPFDATVTLHTAFDPTSAEAVFPALPAAKLLILRHVCDFELPRGQHLAWLSLTYTTQGVSNPHLFIPTFVVNEGMGNEAWLVSEHTHLCIEAGAAIQAYARKGEQEGAMSGSVTLSGELVDP